MLQKMVILYLFKLVNLFKMKDLIVKKLEEVIESNSKRFVNDKRIMAFENAIKEFDLMVEKGLVKKRENNLMSITDSHLHRITLESYNNNSSQKVFSVKKDTVISSNQI